MPSRTTLTLAEREERRKQRAKEWYAARREQILEKQKAYEMEKRQKAREAGLKRPKTNLKAMTEEERIEFKRKQRLEYYIRRKEKNPPKPKLTEEEKREQRNRRAREKRAEAKGKEPRPPRQKLTEEEKRQKRIEYYRAYREKHRDHLNKLARDAYWKNKTEQ